MEIELLRERARAAEHASLSMSGRPPRRRGGWCVRSGSARARRSTRTGAGTPQTARHARTAGGDSARSRAVPVPRRRPSQGPRTASDPGRAAYARTRAASCGRTDCSPRTAGVRATHDGRVMPNYGRLGYSRSTLRGSRTLERSAWGPCAEAASRHSPGSMARCRRRPRVASDGSRRSTCQLKQILASALSRNRKRTGWRSGSRSKRSTAESFRPWPTSWCGTTRPGVSRSLGIKRRSRRARSLIECGTQPSLRLGRGSLPSRAQISRAESARRSPARPSAVVVASGDEYRIRTMTARWSAALACR